MRALKRSVASSARVPHPLRSQHDEAVEQDTAAHDVVERSLTTDVTSEVVEQDTAAHEAVDDREENAKALEVVALEQRETLPRPPPLPWGPAGAR